ncbi:MAG TPA: Cys-tRNA(Pro) deacylase [Ruminococcaceae bacterium]|nr:Cys-tRNA(Pro) deacylase [Oscillospiraceae bacterium]
MKTNVMRMLDRAKIFYETEEYQYDKDNLDGLHAAAQIKTISQEQCFKTLVARTGPRNLLVFCIPVGKELDLKAAAVAAKEKRVELIHVKELPALTGYIRGGCSPIGMKKAYPVFVDKSAEKYDKIGISGGHRGIQVILSPSALVEFVHGGVAHLTR